VRKVLKLKGAVWKQERKSLEDNGNKIHGAEKRSKRKNRSARRFGLSIEDGDLQSGVTDAPMGGGTEEI
jgi:hypothetical protein